MLLVDTLIRVMCLQLAAVPLSDRLFHDARVRDVAVTIDQGVRDIITLIRSVGTFRGPSIRDGIPAAEVTRDYPRDSVWILTKSDPNPDFPPASEPKNGNLRARPNMGRGRYQ